MTVKELANGLFSSHHYFQISSERFICILIYESMLKIIHISQVAHQDYRIGYEFAFIPE